jgi:hypothetical protein
MYRPQFPYATPPGYEDQDFTYSFDFSNVPAIANISGTNLTLSNIILPLQPDEVFLWRGWKVISQSIAPMPLYIQWRDPMGNYLSPCPVPVPHIALPSGVIGWGFAVVPLEPEIPCPAGSNVLVNIFQPAVIQTPITFPRLIMFGVKRGPVIDNQG